MTTLTRTLLAVAATMLVAGGAYAATAPKGNEPAPAAPAAEVKGPCDEAEHAADPRCAGAQVPEDNARHAEDRNGNEVEHHQARHDDNQAEDVGDDNPGNPGEAESHDNRGPGSMNSGPGNAEDRGDQVQAEDNSGPGSDDSGHSESGHSGSGHSGSDDSGTDDSASGGSGRD